MNFDLNDEQKEIKQVAHDLLAARSPFSKVREAAEAGQYNQSLWAELVELGWPGIAVSGEHGGQGLGAVELSVLLEELGYACAATPFYCDGHRGRGDRGHRVRRAAPALAAGAGRRRGDSRDRHPSSWPPTPRRPR